MARKSAASAKVKASELTEEEKIKQMQSVFDDAKWTYLETVKVQVKAAKRVDNYLNIRDLMIKMGMKDPSVEDIKRMLEVSIGTYEQVLKVAEGMTYEQMTKAACPDIFEDIYPQVDQITDKWSEISCAIRFMSITPYGNNLIQMHNLIMQEMERRNMKPEEN